MKLRPKVLSLVLGILIISIALLSIPLYWYTRSALEDEMNKRLLTVCNIAANNLNKDLLNILIQEPSLSTVKETLEAELSRFITDQVDGIAIYGKGGIQLAGERKRETDHPQISVLLQTLSEMEAETKSSVSEIYQLSGGEYFKAAALTIPTPQGSPAVLVAWGGAEFMTVIDQMVGSIFWIVLISVVVGASLAIVFSQSLIRPVRALSDYARSIQKNIYSDQVDLGRDDELGDLNRSLSEMHTEIQQHEQSTKQLLSGIAHEIKNPLGGIEIYSGLLKEELPKEHQSYLGKITGELHHLKQILLEYLDYARPAKSDLKTLPVESVFEDAYRILLPEIKQKKIKYGLSGHGDVLGDESKLRRVFVNLLKNSLEAVNEEGSIRIIIQSENSRVRVEVSDDGAGISEDDIDNIFQPYFTTQDKGYGLGLTIARNIIDEMNGTIIVESEVGKGTKFTVELPGN